MMMPGWRWLLVASALLGLSACGEESVLVDNGDEQGAALAAGLPQPKDGPINPQLTSRPYGQQHGAIIHYEWWVSEALGRGDQPKSSDVSYLKKIGFKSIVNLRSEDNSDQAMAASAKLNYLRIPIVDKTAPTEDQMIQFLDYVTAPANEPAFVHCLAGINRTGVAGIVYRMAVEGWTLDKAVQEADTFGFHTPVQIAFVTQFAADLAAGKIEGYPLDASGQ
jgi:protein tyrosine phosphatase (PTP) superfamily phosphohydrolase (DUF442 family)